MNKNLTHKPFHDGGRYHIETSPLTCGANERVKCQCCPNIETSPWICLTFNGLIMGDLTKLKFSESGKLCATARHVHKAIVNYH